jgi:hypothetical protein
VLVIVLGMEFAKTGNVHALPHSHYQTANIDCLKRMKKKNTIQPSFAQITVQIRDTVKMVYVFVSLDLAR